MDPAMRPLEWIEIDKIIPFASNARTHSKKQIEKLARSMEQRGVTNPLLIDEDNVLLAGHGRLAAARKLKLKALPCIRLLDMTDEDKRAYRVADNQLALEADWNMDLLAGELQFLLNEEYSLELTGFDQADVDGILLDFEDRQTQKPGADDNLAAACRDGAVVFSCIDWRHLPEMLKIGRLVFTEQKNLCIWNKTNAGMGSFYRSQHELVTVWKVGEGPHINNFGLGERGRHRSNVWTYAGVNTFKSGRMGELALHPTVKPVAMVMDAIRDVSHRNHIVLDVFGGSGTTLIAAEKTGRRARLLELDPVYCDVIIRRWEKQTGRRCSLESTGELFQQRSRHLQPEFMGDEP
ncbi:MAG: site-specific DNA-methyltransferase [Sphingomonadales bacterium]